MRLFPFLCSLMLPCVSALAATAPLATSNGPAMENGPRGQIAMLRDALPGYDRTVADTIAADLRRAGFGVNYLTAEQASDPQALTPQRFFAYIIPNSAVYPAHGARALNTYLSGHGNLVLLGGPAFSRLVWSYQGQWIDEQAIHERVARVPTGHVFLDFEGNLPAWGHSTSDPSVKAGMETAPGGAAGTGHCAKIWTADLNGWDTYASPEMPGMFPAGHDLLCFWAKGDAQTTQMTVEMNEADGSRWIAVTPLATDWRYYVLAPGDFRYWKDSKTAGKRGSAEDRFQPRNATRIVFGLAFSHTTAVGAGPHAFWVDQVGTAANPFADFSPKKGERFLPLETVYPSYKTYPLPHPASLAAAPGQAILPGEVKLPTPGAAISAIARPAGKGYGNNRKWRWIPLLEARDAAGERRGTPAWILLNQTAPFNNSSVAVFGLQDAAALRSQPVRNALVAAVNRLRAGIFLSEGGARYFSWWPGEPVELGATALNWGNAPQSAIARITVTAKAGGKRLFQTEKALALAPGGNGSFTQSWNPGAFQDDCVVTTELLAGGKVMDRITHTLGFLNPAPPRKDDFVTVKDGNFVVNGQPWYPVGINFWPLYVSGLEPEEYSRGWIDPAYYDPEEVERDLARMQALGINMVSIQLGDQNRQRNLLDFLRRCARYGVRVNGFLTGASPVAFDEKLVSDYLQAGRLAQNPVLFAYDIIWEPGNSMFNTQGRKRWDRDWEAWLVERYGSVANAEADWGMPAPRENGQVVSPSDQQLRQDGEWRVMVAAYRRFMDDVMSRHWNDAVSRLRQIDPNHLVSFRQGNTLPHDFALTATVKHIDFICPEGYAIPLGEKGYNAAGFITRYVSYTTGGKPIYWAEFGKSVWDASRMQPSESAIALQSEYNDLFYRVVLDAGAQATAPWWWPGGYRVNERSDFGLINPDGTPRPAAQLIARYASRLKTPRPRPAPDTWVTVDRDANAGGYWWLSFNAGADAYAQAHAAGKLLGVRSPGTGTDSCGTPLLAVGNRPYTGKNPPKYLNAEFNRLQVRDRDGAWVDVRNGMEIPVAAGKPVLARVSVGNTQEATWRSPASAAGKPGAVFLAAAAGSGLALRQPIPADTPYLGDADFGEFTLANGLTAATPVALQMTAEGRAWFGEKRSFTLVPR